MSLPSPGHSRAVNKKKRKMNDVLVLSGETVKSRVLFTSVNHVDHEKRTLMGGRDPSCSLPCFLLMSLQEFVTP